MRRIALVGIVLIATIALTGCQSKKWQIELLNSSLTTEFFDFLGESSEWKSEITGEVKNNTGETVTVWLLGRFYNSEDVMFKESYDLLIDMPAGETWKFRVVSYHKDKALRYFLWVDRVT